MLLSWWGRIGCHKAGYESQKFGSSPMEHAMQALIRTALLVLALVPSNTFNNVVVVPIRSGVGLRLGANIGYLKFTPSATWNPF